MLASSKPIHCFSPLSRKLDVGWPRIEDFQLRGHSCVNNVQRCLCHFYTWMRHSKQTATLLLTKRHANFDTSTSAKGYARVCMNCACAIVVLGILLAQARPTMPCIRLVCIFVSLFIYIYGTCVFRIYIHPAPFVRDAIFPHCMLVHCCSREKTNRTENGEEREALLPTRRLIIDVLRDTAANGECMPAQCIIRQSD